MLEAVAILALLMSTVSLTIQGVLLAQSLKKAEPAPTVDPVMMTVSQEEIEAFEKDPTKSLSNPAGMTVDAHFNDAFASSDADFTGIDDNFGV